MYKSNQVLNQTISQKRIKLKSSGYEQLSPNIYQNEKNETVIIKSVVLTTNQNELLSLSLNNETYRKIKNSNISVEVFERNCYRSINLNRYSFKIFGLEPTSGYRSKKYQTKRYKILSYDKVVVDFFQHLLNDFFNYQIAS